MSSDGWRNCASAPKKARPGDSAAIVKSQPMGTLTSRKAQDRLSVGYALDHLWSETMRLPDGDSKEQPLRLIAQLLEQEGVPYALIDASRFSFIPKNRGARST